MAWPDGDANGPVPFWEAGPFVNLWPVYSLTTV
jgi:hypothetical protein